MHGAVITVLLHSDGYKASLACAVTKQLIHSLDRGGHCAFGLMWPLLMMDLSAELWLRKVLLKIISG